MARPVAIDRVTALAIDPGAFVRLSGTVATSTDGSSFDAVFAWSPTGIASPGGLFDLAAGGLRVVDTQPAKHAYVLAVTDAPGPACVAAGVPSPCLVPRLGELAHARLRTAREFEGTLSGRLSAEEQAGPARDAAAAWAGRAIGWAALALAAVSLVALLVRRRARSPLGRVRSAARRALRATRADATFEGLRDPIAAMVARAISVDAARRTCARRLRSLRAAHGSTPDAAPWIQAERAEAERIERHRDASLVDLERIEGALRWVTLRARALRDAPTTPAATDPVETLAVELALRDQAVNEANAMLTGPRTRSS